MTHLQIFLSCVSAEFDIYRPALRRALDRPNVTVKVQEDFIAGGEATLIKLDDYIRACDAVVHLVGDMTGAIAQWPSVVAIAERYPDFGGRFGVMAQFLEPGAPGLPYTQWEAWLALYHCRPLFIAAPSADAPRGERYLLDESAREAQKAHLKRLEVVERYAEVEFGDVHQLAARLLQSQLLDLLVRAEAGEGAGKIPVDLAAHFGFAAAPTGFRNLVDHFLRMYLGTSKVAVPFGGRGRELEAMNAWLEGRAERNDAPLLGGQPSAANLLVHAPAGRGKTALLIRWITQLDERWARVFVPVSIRAKTNEELTFYQALAAQLAAQLGEPLPQPRADPAAYYRDKVIEYFGRIGKGPRDCLVVIDGLDEARGWQLDTSVLPFSESTHLKVLVSARELAGDEGSRDWLQRLGWTPPLFEACTLSVGPLTRAGVADVLESMRFPIGPLSQDVDIVDELYRLSDGGDPLVLHYYANDLLAQGAKAARLRPQDLSNLKPGFGAYIEGWLNEQRAEWKKSAQAVDESLLDAILAALAHAHGPLKLAELEQVVMRILPGFKIFKASTVEPLQRFIIGHGTQGGYVLAHPKLATILQQDYFAGTQILTSTKTAFLSWMRDVMAGLASGTLSVQAVPTYVLTFSAQHLASDEAAVTPADWVCMLDEGWRLAWQAHEGGVQGYARDLEAVARALRNAADRDPAQLARPRTGLGAHVRCVLRLSSIRSAGLGASGEVLAEFVRSHKISPARALHLSRFKPDYQREDTISVLIGLLPLELKLQAFAAASDIAAPRSRYDYLMAVAPELPEDSREKAWETALQLVPLMKDSWDRDRALEALKPHVAESTWLRVEAASRSVDWHSTALSSSRRLTYEEQRELESRSLEEDLTPEEIVDIVRQLDWSAYTTAQIVDRLGSRLPLAAQQLAIGAVQDPELNFSSETLVFIARHVAAELLGNFISALVKRRWGGLEALQTVAERFGSQLPRELQRLTLDAVRANAAPFSDLYLFPFMVAHFDPELHEELLQLLLARATRWSSDFEPSWSALLARGAISVEHMLDAVLDSRLPHGDQAASLGALVKHLSPTLLISALDRVLAMRGYAAGRCLNVLTPHVPLECLVAIARSPGTEHLLGEMLAPLMVRLPTELLPEAVSWVERIPNVHERAPALSTLLPRLREAGLSRSIAEAYDVAFNIGDADERVITEAVFAARKAVGAVSSEEAFAAASLHGSGQADDGATAARVFATVIRSRLLPESERTRLLEVSMAATLRIRDQTMRAIMLGLIASRLPEPARTTTISQALELAESSENLQEDAMLAPCLLTLYRRSEEVAPALEALRARAEKRAQAGEKTQAATSLIDCALAILAGAPVQDLLEKARAVVKGDGGERSDADQVESLASAIVLLFAQALPEGQLSLLREHVINRVPRLADVEMRVQVMAALANYLPTERLWPWVSQVLAQAAELTRPGVLLMIAALHGLIQEVLAHNPALGGNRIAVSPLTRLGGETGAEEILGAIAEVRAIWP